MEHKTGTQLQPIASVCQEGAGISSRGVGK